MPASTSKPSSDALSARISSIRSASASGVTWSPNPCEAEWSVTARYSSPRPRAASTICSSVWRPSLKRRVAVQVAAHVLRGHQPREPRPARQRRLELPAALAQLRRDPRQPERLVDLLLGRAAHGLAGRVVEDPVLGHVQPAPHRALAQRHVVRLRAREVLEDVPELVRLDDLEIHLHARVRHHARARVARGVQHRLDQRQLAQRRRQRRRVLGGGDDVEVLDRVGLAPQRARHLDLLRARVRAQRADDLLGDVLRPRQQDPRRRAAPLGRLGERLEQLLLDLRAEAAQLADLLLLGGRAQGIQGVDPELVVEPPRALRPEARQVHDREQPARELVAQLLGRRDVAGLVEREDLLLEDLADPVELGDAAVARQLHHRHGRLADGLGRRAVGDHAVGDGAVELVEVAELVERGGDLGVGQVGHAP